MESIISDILVIVQAIVFGATIVAIPIYLTVMNVKGLIGKHNKASIKFDIATILIGGVYSVIYCNLWDITTDDWDTAIYSFQYHSVLSTQYEPTIDIILVLSLIGLVVLSVFSPRKLPPLASATAMAMVPIGFVAGLFILIQLANNVNIIALVVYYVNLILISVRVTYYHITEHVRLNHERDTAYRTKLGYLLSKVMTRVSSMTVFTFSLIAPIVIILEVVFILCGQGADGFIKAFTMTADWTFSTQTPPPPIEYSGHYLCTVAVQGHEKVVRPLRYGKRLGKRIVVNRQLLVANAFEDLIKERLPRFHRIVRHIYDTYGYPISKYITTKARADIVYILMKPLEYTFLLVLYLFDTHPENRIAVQYSDYKKGGHVCQ